MGRAKRAWSISFSEREGREMGASAMRAYHDNASQQGNGGFFEGQGIGSESSRIGS